MIVTLLIASLAAVLRIIRQVERGKLARTMRDASSEPGCSCDQEQPCPRTTAPMARAT
jgi:hypothetical protein